MNGSNKSKRVLRWTARWVLVFCAVVILVKFVWIFLVPSLFPGAVDEGFIVASLSWLTALKIGILVMGLMLARDFAAKRTGMKRP